MSTELQSIIASMTLEEKAALCTGASAWTTTPVERLGVPEMTVADGPHGVRRVPDVQSMSHQALPATCFPTASCSASTWDVELMGELGVALAEEAIALNVDVLLGPSVNMKRSPLGGRNFEYFSEDPYLAGELAVHFVKGVQSKGVGTSLKHYAANNQEFQRFSISAEVDERTLREIYLPAFEKAVKEAQPWTVMCSYHKVNGVFASEHHTLLTEILKEEWGFEGLVVSDWGAVRDRVTALRAGLDWEMPGPQDRHVKAVVEAVRSGGLAEASLDESVRRMLQIVFKAHETRKGGTFDADAHHSLARRIAAEGMVLLKNEPLPPQEPLAQEKPLPREGRLLPLKGHQRIAVIGRSAQVAYFQGGGSSHINPTRVDVPFQELQSRADGAELIYAEGYPADDSFRQDLIDQATGLAQLTDVALLFIALPVFKESEGYDRRDLDLTAQQVALVQAVARVQPRTVVVLNSGGPLAMNAWIDAVPAVLEGWMMGQAGGAALADILFGQANPCGKLAETFPLKITDTPAYLNWPGGAGKVRYGEGLFIGYRYYDARELPVLFPFGHGLSYTSFAYSNPRVSAKTFRDVDGLTVTVDVTNTGNMAGKEIVQAYVHDRASGLVRPEKALKGFAKVALQPGETRSVAIKLDFRAFAYYHPQYRQWITEDGEFDILIASSSADIHHSLAVTLESTLHLPCILDRESTVREWMADPRGKVALGPFYAQTVEQHRKVLGGDGDGDTMGVDAMDMMDDMALLSVWMWQKSTLPVHPEDLVDRLLAEVHGQSG